MERRHFLKLAFGFVAGATVLAASAKAAPLPPIGAQPGLVPPHGEAAEPAVTTQDDVDHLAPQEVRWDVAAAEDGIGAAATGAVAGIGAGAEGIGAGAATTGVTGDGTGTGAATGGEVPFATIFS